ncbi:MAG: ADP-ribosylglycohydrolase family protein, partial [Candidatus Brocadiaceae bacterium]
MGDDLYPRVLGCMVGGAIGDAFGGPIEMKGPEYLEELAGKLWIDEFLHYGPDHGVHPLGVWQPSPPRGTGTDDLRNNQAFVECVVRNSGFINSQLLAIEYIERFREPERFYPSHHNLARQYLRGKYLRSCAHLGMQELPDGREGRVVRARGNGFPTLGGLISLAPSGLLYRDEPERAYRKAFELGFLDVGYARDATAMMAAMVSAALGGQVDARGMVEVGMCTDPFGYGERRVMVRRIRRFLEIAGEARDDEDLIGRLSPEVAHLHLFDPVDVLGTP